VLGGGSDQRGGLGKKGGRIKDKTKSTEVGWKKKLYLDAKKKPTNPAAKKSRQGQEKAVGSRLV